MFEDYLDAKKSGDRQFRRDLNENHDPYLPTLDALLGNNLTMEMIPLGNIEIPLSMVVGTKNPSRANSFASNFMPIADKSSEFAYKWTKLFEYQIDSGITDPVKAYEYLGKFYIEEGNKRVSVMKYLGNPSIYASVTRIMPERTSENEIYFEFLDFYNVAPIYEINFTRRGSYQRFARLMQRDLIERWPDDLVRSIEGAFFRFSRVFYENGGQNLEFSAADAFLKYLTIYSFDSLLDVSGALLENRVHNIWNELLVEANPSEAMVLNDNVEQKNTLFSLFTRGPVYSENKPLKIAFLYADSPLHSGWDSDHEIGRIYLNHAMKGLVETFIYKNCNTEKKILRAVKLASARGAKVIFATSGLQFNAIVRCATEYKDIIFFNCVINTSSNIVRTYYGRLFEIKYLLGILAGQLSTNHKVAYLADYPIYGTIANLNAFALGAAAIDPQIKVHVYWNMDDWKQEIRKEGITLVCGLDIAEPDADNIEYGLFSYEDGEIVNYAAPVWNWGKYYERIARPIANGTFDYSLNQNQSMFLWWGLTQNVLDINVSADLSYYTRKTVKTYKEMIRKDVMSPFDGELRSQSEIIRKKKSGRLSDRKIISMDWLNDNIIGRMPEYDELDSYGKALFEVNGIIRGE